MSVPAMKHWLSPSLRRNRKSFVLSGVIALNVILAAALTAVYFALSGSADFESLLRFLDYVFIQSTPDDVLNAFDPRRLDMMIALLSIIIIGSFYILFVLFLTAQRLRDMDITGWLCLLWLPASFLPGLLSVGSCWAFMAALCFIPGTQGDNDYGPDPLGS